MILKAKKHIFRGVISSWSIIHERENARWVEAEALDDEEKREVLVRISLFFLNPQAMLSPRPFN